MFHFEVSKKVGLPGGGTVTVTIQSSGPINESDYLILQPQAATEMSYCLASMANALKPPESPEIVLGHRGDCGTIREPPKR
jgi:hypothetical protein